MTQKKKNQKKNCLGFGSISINRNNNKTLLGHFGGLFLCLNSIYGIRLRMYKGPLIMFFSYILINKPNKTGAVFYFRVVNSGYQGLRNHKSSVNLCNAPGGP